jgi:hypothetical protein
MAFFIELSDESNTDLKRSVGSKSKEADSSKDDSDKEVFSLASQRKLRRSKSKSSAGEDSCGLPSLEVKITADVDIKSSDCDQLFHSSQLQLDGASVIESCDTPDCNAGLDDPRQLVLEPVLSDTSLDQKVQTEQKSDELLSPTKYSKSFNENESESLKSENEKDSPLESAPEPPSHDPISGLPQKEEKLLSTSKDVIPFEQIGFSEDKSEETSPTSLSDKTPDLPPKVYHHRIFNFLKWEQLSSNNFHFRNFRDRQIITV